MARYSYFRSVLLGFSVLICCGISGTGVARANYAECSGRVEDIMNGRCDEVNNNFRCDYDGGDCCECTCKEGLEYPCVNFGVDWSCRDPAAGCVRTEHPIEISSASGDLLLFPSVLLTISPTASPTASPTTSLSTTLTVSPTGSPSASPSASPTASPSASPTASPSASPTASPLLSVYPFCEGMLEGIGDGLCDSDNNNDDCDYDGGDCCECTCEATFGCGTRDYNCLDPRASSGCLVTPSPLSSTGPPAEANPINESVCSGFLPFIGDGFCDQDNNVPACDYDGGDCCECTCVPAEHDCTYFACMDPFGLNNCTDPNAASRDGGLKPWNLALTIIGMTIAVGGSISGLIFCWYREKQQGRSRRLVASAPANPPATSSRP